MRIIRRNSTKLFLSIFAIILCICPLYTTAQAPDIRELSHTEGSGSPPRVFATRIYPNGTVVARIVRNSPTTQNCFEEILSLRIIHPDGSVDEKEINLSIPQVNYCQPKFLDYQLIRQNQILITYYNAPDTNNPNAYEQWGMIVDFNGVELSRKNFGPVIIPDSEIVLNIDREKGFLRLSPAAGDSTAWQQYKVEPDGSITPLVLGNLSFNYFSGLTAALSTVGEGYTIIYAYMTNVGATQNPLSEQGSLYSLTIGYNQSTVSSTILYQTPVPNIIFTDLSCDIASAGVGQVCTLTVVVTATGTFYVQVNFLSSGSVSSSKVIIRNVSENFLWKVNSLPYSGYLLTNVTSDGTNNVIYGYLFREDDTDFIQWAFPEPEPINSDGIFQILPNNTLLIFSKETSNSWGFSAVDLPKFLDRTDDKYSNINVNSTVPPIGAFIGQNVTDTISISFYNPVILSDGKLSIYQVIDGQPNLRQSTSGIACSVADDGKTVNAEVLISTFGISNGNYFIAVDNDFVKDAAYKESLLGIEDNIWYFSTQERTYDFSPSKSGLFRLTPEGTEMYDNLSREDRHGFFNTLRSELSLAIPVPLSRLTTIEKVQLDRSVNKKQYFISIRIEETKVEQDISVASVIDYINTMVINKDQSPIGQGPMANFLDETYGFNRLLGIWEKHRTKLIVLFFIIIFFIGAYISAVIKSPQTKEKPEDDNPKHVTGPVRNVAVLQFGLIVFDLVMDILFVSISAKDFPVLYVLSVVFVTVPIAINAILAFYIITKENSTNKDFYNWFMNNGKVASVFTVLGGANIEALNILKSNLLGIKLFAAPISPGAEKLIFRGNILNIIIEDIPQVIIQILYFHYALYYDIVPLLAFVSSLLTLTIGLLGPIVNKLYENYRGRSGSSS